MEQASQGKKATTVILEDATFKLYRWASNMRTLEDNTAKSEVVEDQTAKQELGVSPRESKILWLTWNEFQDTLSVLFPKEECNTTGKR